MASRHIACLAAVLVLAGMTARPSQSQDSDDQISAEARQWSEALDNGGEDARSSAAISIGLCGEKAAACVPALLRRLRDEGESFEVRTFVLKALAEMGPHAAPAVELLAGEASQGADDPANNAVRDLAVLAEKNELAAGELVGFLGSTSRALRLQAALALPRSCAKGREAAVRLGALLLEKDPEVQSAAARALQEFGEEAVDTIGGLRHALGSEAPAVATNAAVALAGIGAKASMALPELQILLQSESRSVRAAAGFAVWAICGEAGEAVSFLCSAIEAGESQVLCIRLLARMGKAASDALPLLRKLRHASSRVIRRNAVAAFGEVAEPGVEALDFLEGAFADSDSSVRRAAARGVLKIARCNPAGIPVVLKLLDDEDMCVRRAVIAGVGELGARGAPAVARLAAHLTRGGESYLVMESLRNIGSESAVLVLIEQLRVPSRAGRALEEIEALGSRAKIAEALLEGACSDRALSIETRSRLLELLAKLRDE